MADSNQVMVGINPIKEWPKIYEKLQKGKVFAGDVAKWDKGMVPEFQRASYRDWETDRKSTRLNSSHITRSRMPSSA